MLSGYFKISFLFLLKRSNFLKYKFKFSNTIQFPNFHIKTTISKLKSKSNSDPTTFKLNSNPY